MAVRGARPPESDGPSCWGRVDADAGKSFEAWVAGDAIAIDSHFIGRTIPCLRRYHGPNVECEGCAKPTPVEFVYYLPLYRWSDTKPVFVILHKDQEDMVNRVKLHQLVRIGRTEEELTGLYMSLVMRKETFETALGWKKRPANLALYLPTIWRMRGVLDAETVLRGPLRCVEPAMPAIAGEDRTKKLSPEETRKKSAETVGRQFKVRKPPADEPLANDVQKVLRNRLGDYVANGDGHD